MPDEATRDFGASLKEARERVGITLRTIANTTKISVPTLEALERNDISRLPGGIFIRAFVRAYAKEVGLDPEEAVRGFVARFPEAAVDESPATYEANPEKIVVDEEPATGRTWRVVVWSLPLIAVIAFFGFGGRLSWLWGLAQPAVPRAEQQAEQSPPAPTAPVLTTPAAATMPDQASPSAAGGSGGAPPTIGADGLPTGLGEARAGDIPPRSGDVPPTRLAEGAAKPADTPVAAAGEGRFQLTLTARGRCWVTVRSDGKIVYTGTMNVGDRQNLTTGGNVSLTLGNAGVMGVALDGQPTRTLGREGEVVTVLLNAQNLKTFLESR